MNPVVPPGSSFSTPRRSIPCWIIGLVLVVALTLGCAAQRRSRSFSPEVGLQTWREFRDKTVLTTAPPFFHIQASLNYVTPDRKNRVLLDLWGNFDHPVRLDVTAGIGGTYALWREDALGWMAYYPSLNTVYVADRTPGLPAMPGGSFPFGMLDLALILDNRPAVILPEDYCSIAAEDQGRIRFTFAPGEKVSDLTLDTLARPARMTGSMPTPWTLTFDEWTATDQGDRPLKLTLTGQDGTRAILRVKDRQFPSSPWDQEALGLTLPTDTIVRQLGDWTDSTLPEPDS